MGFNTVRVEGTQGALNVRGLGAQITCLALGADNLRYKIILLLGVPTTWEMLSRGHGTRRLRTTDLMFLGKLTCYVAHSAIVGHEGSPTLSCTMNQLCIMSTPIMRETIFRNACLLYLLLIILRSGYALLAQRMSFAGGKVIFYVIKG